LRGPEFREGESAPIEFESQENARIRVFPELALSECLPRTLNRDEHRHHLRGALNTAQCRERRLAASGCERAKESADHTWIPGRPEMADTDRSGHFPEGAGKEH
jgi:hypothetical protein